MCYLYDQKYILLDWNMRSDLEKLVLQRWTCDIFAGSQRSMSVKDSFNQTNIALISVEKLNIFQLKWVIYMPSVMHSSAVFVSKATENMK